MFKKLKQKIEAGEEGSTERLSFPPSKTPGSAVRSPPASDAALSFTLASPAHIQPLSSQQDLSNSPVKSGTLRTSLSTDKEETRQDLLQNDNFAVEHTTDNHVISADDQSDSSSHMEEMKRIKEEQQERQQLQSEHAKQVAELQDVVSQLTEELALMRGQYERLREEKLVSEVQLQQQLYELQSSLEQSETEVKRLSAQVPELNQTVERLTARLQLYSSYSQDEVVKKLQSKVGMLEKAVRERDVEITIYESRLAAQNQQRMEEHESSSDTVQELKRVVAKLTQRVEERQIKTDKLYQELQEKEAIVADVSRSLSYQKIETQKLEHQLKEDRETHSGRLQELVAEHRKALAVTEQELSTTKSQLTEAEQQLERMVRELPTFPVTRAVLEGYSRAHLFNSLPTILRAPGGVYRKDTAPVLSPNGTEDGSHRVLSHSRHSSASSEDDEEDGEEEQPAVLPVQNHLYSEKLLVEHPYPQINEQLLKLQSENERLEEELSEKRKTIRLQQQTISDVKKTLNRELKAQVSSEAPVLLPPLPPLSFPQLQPDTLTAISLATTDLNFEYLKNVVLRFLCCREDEACQLVRAVSTLLKLNTEEEQYVKDYLQYKMSWFGRMPAPPKSAVKND